MATPTISPAKICTKCNVPLPPTTDYFHTRRASRDGLSPSRTLMPDVTFVIPCGPYHRALLDRALASIEAQTVPCSTVVIHDTARRGAGYARNRGIERVTTEFVTFLDADDEVLPTFVEQALAAYQPGKWVYTDWLDDETPYSAPPCPWMPGTRNVITTLLRTEDVRAAGGFDETLDGLEDTQFYLNLLKRGVCGAKVPIPLFRYHKEGERSKAIYGTPAYHATMQRFSSIYKELTVADNCGGCGAGNNGPIGGLPYSVDPNGVIGAPQPGDVIALARWGGNQRKYGPISGRLYERAGNGKRMWVHPDDVRAAPDWWERVEQPRPAAPLVRDTRPQRNEVTRIVLDTASEPEPRIEPSVLDGVRAIGQTLFRSRDLFPTLPPPPKDTTPRAPVPPKAGGAKKARELYRGAGNG